MNRRGFFSTLAKAAAGFTILPAAATYERIWRVQRPEFLIVDSFTQFEGVDFYNRLPLWQVRIINGLSRGPLDTVWLKLLNKSPFPPNMGEVISTNTNH